MIISSPDRSFIQFLNSKLYGEKKIAGHRKINEEGSTF
jgi:hypothetical protein